MRKEVHIIQSNYCIVLISVDLYLTNIEQKTSKLVFDTIFRYDYLPDLYYYKIYVGVTTTMLMLLLLC